MALTRGNGLAFQGRVSNGGGSTHTSGGNAAAPSWIKLVHSSNSFSAYKSSDGMNWILVGTLVINMTASAHVGLAVTSHNNPVLNRSTFQNVSVTAGAPPIPTPTPTPTPAAPRFHRDCGTGQLLMGGICQPIETALAASGGRVYWVAQAATNASDSKPGTRAEPWRTITRATQVLQPGDAVIVRAGTYRESVSPPRGGIDAARRITYAAYTGEQVIISGADMLPAQQWMPSGTAWRHSWTEDLPAYGDGSVLWRREMVIVDGTVMRAVGSRAAVVPGTFYVEGSDKSPTAIYLRLPGDAPPSGHVIEGARRHPLFQPINPNNPYLDCGDPQTPGYLRVIGFIFRHATNRAQ